MKSPIASLPITMGPRMRSSKVTSPAGTAKRSAAGSPAARRRCDLGRRRAAGSGRRSAAARPAASAAARSCVEALLAAEAGVGERRRRRARRRRHGSRGALGSGGTGRTARRGRAPRPRRGRARRGRRGWPARSAPRSAPRRCLRCADEAPAGVAGEQVVVQRGARRADVQGARGARRKAHSHRVVETYGHRLVVVSPGRRRPSPSLPPPIRSRRAG